MKKIEDLKIKIYLDGANKEDILDINNKSLIKGLTTNPSLMKKAGIKDYKFLIKLTNKLLNEVTIGINKFHNLNYSHKYWKIILLPWLQQLTVFFYDRWEMIDKIPKTNLIFCIYN